MVRDTGNGNKPTFQCVCPIGYSHSFCEVAVSDNACLNSPCNNGGTCTLVSNISNYTCSCPVGWKGKAHFPLSYSTLVLMKRPEGIHISQKDGIK